MVKANNYSNAEGTRLSDHLMSEHTSGSGPPGSGLSECPACNSDAIEPISEDIESGYRCRDCGRAFDTAGEEIT